MEKGTYIYAMKKEILSIIEQGNVCNLYVNDNHSLQSIANIYSCSIPVIIRILNKNGIKRRKHTRSLYNKAYFNEINSKEKAYFLGLLYADGCNYEKGITLSLQMEDYKIIETFKKSIGFTGKINYRNHTNPKYKGIVRIKIHDEHISNQLSNLGVVPRKSLVTKYPNIPKELYPHFIRGVFDGDGCISLYKVYNKYNTCQFSIMGNILFIKKIEEIINENCNFSKGYLHKNKKHDENIVSLVYSGKKKINKIIDWLYLNSDELYLERKFLKFKQVKKWDILK